jgi:iron complex transport system substrate-binding protein
MNDHHKNNIRLCRSRREGKGILLFVFLLVSLPFTLCSATYADPPARIISLAPSVTEILFSAGLGDNIVGVTTFCDYPEEAKAKPKIGGMSNPSLEAVVSLQPDIVIMTTDGNPREFKQKLLSLKLKVFVFKALTLPELPDGIREMGAALDAEERFDALASDIENKINTFRQRKTAKNRKILYIVWPEPLIVAGPKTAVDDAIHLLGGINLAGNAKGRYPKFSLEEIVRQSPDVIFIGEGRGMEEVSRGLLKRLANLRAVKKGRVFFVSDRLYKLGPGVIEGIEELAGHLEVSGDSGNPGFE